MPTALPRRGLAVALVASLVSSILTIAPFSWRRPTNRPHRRKSG